MNMLRASRHQSRPAPPDQTAGHLLPRLSAATGRRIADRLGALPFFSSATYSRLHPDVGNSGIDPALHAARYGAAEGRQLFVRTDIARVLAKIDPEDDDTTIRPQGDREPVALAAALGPIGVYVSSQGNLFMSEIAADIVAELRAAGVAARLLDERSDRSTRPASAIFVAPHEFFLLGQGPVWLSEEIVTRAVVYNTEQMQTQWFGRSVPALLAAGGVLDICAQSAAILTQAGVHAAHFEPAVALDTTWLAPGDDDHPLFKVLPRAAKGPPDPAVAWEERPIDISFFGSESQRRESFFGRAAPALARYPSFIYYRRNHRGPIRDSDEDRALTRLAGHVAAHSKIALNIHRDEYPYFEWHRIARQGMGTGAVVVTDPCLPHPLYKPGVHYLQEEARYIPDLLDWLLSTPEGQDKARAVQAAATATLRATAAGGRVGGLLQFIARARGIGP